MFLQKVIADSCAPLSILTACQMPAMSNDTKVESDTVMGIVVMLQLQW